MNEPIAFVGAQVPPELKAKLEQAAQELDLSMAQIVRRALAAFLAERDKTRPEEQDRNKHE